MRHGVINTVIGRNIRHQRYVAGISEKAAAQSLGVSLKTYLGYEIGTVRASCDEVIELAKLFGCPVDRLWHGAGPSSTCFHEHPWHPYGVPALLDEFNRIRTREGRDRVCAIVGRVANRTTSVEKANL